MGRIRDSYVVKYSYCFGLAVKEIRRCYGISRKELAEKVGVDQSYLCRIENNMVSPTLNTVFRILSVFDADFQIIY